MPQVFLNLTDDFQVIFLFIYDRLIITQVYHALEEFSHEPLWVIFYFPINVRYLYLINIENKDGTYREELLFVAMVSVVTARVACIQINKLNGMDASGIVVKKDDAVSTRLSYPVWRIAYKTGSN